LSWVHLATDRRVRLLQALGQHPAGLTLGQALTAIGEAGKRSRAATVVMLNGMRKQDQVAYQPPDPRTWRPGTRPSGTYTLTPAGQDWLVKHGFSIEDGPAAVPVTTGAMEGDRGLVRHSTARPGQAPAGATTSVFDPARIFAARTPPDRS